MSRLNRIEELYKISEEISARHNYSQKGAEALSARLGNIIAGTAFGGLSEWVASIGRYESFYAWIRLGIPDFAQGEAKAAALRAIGYETAGIVAAAASIPMLASWNFDRLSSPESKIRSLFSLKGEKALEIKDFDERDVNWIVDATRYGSIIESEPSRLNAVTGTPPPLNAYLMMAIRAGGGVGELRGLVTDGIVSVEVLRFVSRAAAIIKQNLNKDIKNKSQVLERIRLAALRSEAFRDTPHQSFIG